MNADALAALSEALTTYAAGDFAIAAKAAQAAGTADPTSRLAREAATYLGRVVETGKAGVYISGEAFGAFIRAGGNVPLYTALSTTLREIYAAGGPLTLLDIGVGDGLALLPALTPAVTRVDLVEPSAPLLGRTTSALAARGVNFRAFAMDILTFAERTRARWDLAQATFSLQALPPDARRTALHWLRSRVPRLLIAEFDLPELGEGLDSRRVTHFAARYEEGLAEYAHDDSLVAQGFLMPVFFGYFDPSVARANYEQPLDAWEDDLRAAGFTTVTRRKLYNYWWAPAYLLDTN